MQCVDIFPVKALDGREYPEGLTDKKTCATRLEALYKRYISPCGLCIKVCPIGEDRKLYMRQCGGSYIRSVPSSVEACQVLWREIINTLSFIRVDEVDLKTKKKFIPLSPIHITE